MEANKNGAISSFHSSNREENGAPIDSLFFLHLHTQI